MLVDFHSHIYKNFDLERCLKAALYPSSTEVKVAFLTERSDCDFFKELEVKIDRISDLNITSISSKSLQINSYLNIFAGRQYASSEGIEVLSLFRALDMQDRLTAEEYCKAIIESDGIVAFSWAFGKWFKPRGEKILELALRYGKEKVIILDSRIRPAIFPLPQQMIDLTKQGFKFLAGSDPLPLTTHQKNILSFGAILEDPKENQDLELCIREQLLRQKDFEFFGKRSGVFEFVKDQLMLRIK